MNGDDAPLGQYWMRKFLRRNPRVHSIVGRSIDAERAKAADPEVIRAFLQLFEETRRRLGIQPEDMWNMDETGVALGVCNNSQVIASAHKSKAYNKSPEDREWVSIVEVVSATGQKLRPVVIFKGHSLQTTWFPCKSVPDWFYTTSDNGWTSNSVGLEWLRRIFIPDSTPASGGDRLLILDGHGSHVSTEFMWTCYQHRIHCIYLPAHSSHVLQPLDLAPFSVVKSKYRDQIRALSALDDAAPIKKERFITSYNAARIRGLSERVIRAGWRATGLVPYDPELVLSSSQVQTRPMTPPGPVQPIYVQNIHFTTPQRSQDLYKARQLLGRSEKLTRSTRLLLGKAGKAISAANTRAAELQASNQRLQYKLDQLKIKKPRKRIRPNPNERFSNVEAIRAAMDQAAAQAAQNAAKSSKKKAVKVVNQSATATLDSMCIQWQI
tara:strand:- start:2227 stop:3540 length:1314 start_codon:yes stop_codon:yes gene_type:complete